MIRDDVGTIQGAFTGHFGLGTNNRTELKAITEGIFLCKMLSCFNVIIKSDSRVVVDWLLEGRCTLWYLWDFWDELLNALEGISFMVVHQYRDGNQEVDFLDDKARWKGILLMKETRIYQGSLLIGIICLDKLGFPCLWI